MGRFYGMTLLSSCLTWYKTKGSLDATVPLTVMLSRLFVCTIFVIIAAEFIVITVYLDKATVINHVCKTTVRQLYRLCIIFCNFVKYKCYDLSKPSGQACVLIPLLPLNEYLCLAIFLLPGTTT